MSVRYVSWDTYCGWDGFDEDAVYMADRGTTVPADTGVAEVAWHEATGAHGPTVELRFYLAQSDSGPDSWYESVCSWEGDEWRCNGEGVELAAPGSLPDVTCDRLETAL